jgi:hypothetical protein
MCSQLYTGRNSVIMNSQKAHQLETLTNHIQQKWGKKALLKLEEKENISAREYISTGYESLDIALGGSGIPLRDITLLRGAPTAGVTTLAYRLAAQTQQQELVIIYLDCSNTFDGEYAATICGISQSQLLIINPPDITQGFSLLRDTISLPYQGVIVLDLGLLASEELNIVDTSLHGVLNRIKGLLRQSGWTLLIVLPVALAHGCSAYAAVEMIVSRENWIYDTDLPEWISDTHREEWVIGYKACITVTRHVFGSSGQTANISINVEEEDFDYMLNYP